MAKPINITGQTFGWLTAIRLIPQEQRHNSYHRREWLCKCQCGNEIIVEQRFLTVRGKQHVDSCGCLRKRAHLLATSKCPWLTLEYLQKWKDWDKFAFLHKALIRAIPVTELTERYYFNFIQQFYNQAQFNIIYTHWQQHKQQQTFYDLAKPSLDHIIPKARGGSNDLDNLQFLTVFENLNKRDMTQTEWEEFKRVTNTHSNYYIESIMEGGKK